MCNHVRMTRRRMRARGRRDTTQQLVRAMHETLQRLVENNNALTANAIAMGGNLRELNAQMAALGAQLIELEGQNDDLDTRVSRLEKKGKKP